MSISTYAVIRNNQRHAERNMQMAFNNRHSHSESSVTDKRSEIVTDKTILALVGSFVDCYLKGDAFRWFL